MRRRDVDTFHALLGALEFDLRAIQDDPENRVRYCRALRVEARRLARLAERVAVRCAAPRGRR